MKGGKKETKKKVTDPVPQKDWYDVKAPVMFNTRNIGKTLVMRTPEFKLYHVFEMSLVDLQDDEEDGPWPEEAVSPPLPTPQLMSYCTGNIRGLEASWPQARATLWCNLHP